jgi:peptidoglycan hydrolase CwlO-like protein
MDFCAVICSGPHNLHVLVPVVTVADHLQEIKERDGTISEKEKRIYDLKKKNQELEKFKFVLDHKIKELKQQIEPKDDEIADMNEQIKVLCCLAG